MEYESKPSLIGRGSAEEVIAAITAVEAVCKNVRLRIGDVLSFL
jgi:hypothetical protein